MSIFLWDIKVRGYVTLCYLSLLLNPCESFLLCAFLPSLPLGLLRRWIFKAGCQQSSVWNKFTAPSLALELSWWTTVASQLILQSPTENKIHTRLPSDQCYPKLDAFWLRKNVWFCSREEAFTVSMQLERKDWHGLDYAINGTSTTNRFFENGCLN